MALRVLAPLDGSETSFKALDAGLRLLKATPGLEVTVFNVTSEGLSDAPEDLVAQFDEDEDDEIFPTQAASLRMLERAKTICKEHAVAAKVQVVEGGVVDSILAACANHDILLMHALDRTQLKENLRGSQTEKLARRAGINVLLVATP